MLIEELDGFIAGLLVCPDLIKPGEWLPIVWGQDSDDPRPPLTILTMSTGFSALIMEHYNGVARTLMERPDRYSPLFAVDKRNGDILWELWIEGFEKAVKLRPAAWQRLLNTDADHGDRDARNADASRCRPRRSTRAAERQRRPDCDGPRQHRALDRHTQCMADR